jgi:hypothetical protein
MAKNRRGAPCPRTRGPQACRAPDGNQIEVVAVHRSERLVQIPRAIDVAQEESFDVIGGRAD